MIRKRLAALQRRMSVVVSVVTFTAVIVLMSWHRSTVQREVLSPTQQPPTQRPQQLGESHSGNGAEVPLLSVEKPQSSVHGATRDAHLDSTASPAIESCVAAKKDVLLVGNRPVGTYLCSYFPTAKIISGGCKLPCGGSGSTTSPFTCTILNMGSSSQMKSADIVVNHHGPIPTKFSPLEPVITLFYSGESNVSEGLKKKASHAYQIKYDNVVSFHQHRPWYFTWTNRFEGEFRAVLAGTLQKDWPAWEKRRNAVAIFVSRCKKGGRERVIQALKDVYPVHSFGKCFNTHRIENEFPKCAALPGGRYPQKLCVFNQYKYILALDNTRELDYVTEKVYHALVAGAVPIYDGAPNADKFLPGGWGSVVRLSDFDDGSGGTDYLRLQRTLQELEHVESPKLEGLKEWTKATSEEAWGDEFVANLHHGEPTCDVCDAARRKKCEGAAL
ncbi:glycosyltransferase-like, putative [Bodo saltans]|uniref:Fucosyltransferase n=1 Tax=Bodo saltans TaxID=75058 RepID=A0A0S4KIV9_BODSA|nr:glycosyltransferase-like, putative [Bodo saltans]|eukprot:CUI15622.1 glycosyltransferase-like, putative [Bodo saltans]